MRRFLPPLLTAALLVASATGQQPEIEPIQRNVVLVTADGLRWQEVFRGADPELIRLEEAGMGEAAEKIREKYWADSPEERRRKLMPFLWTEVASNGLLLGNRDRNSAVDTKNLLHFSYPGYAEILTGRPHDRVVTSNDMRPSPVPTVLELVQQPLVIDPTKVALFASWEVFRGIGSMGFDTVLINAGFQRLEFSTATPRLRELSQAQFEILTPWDSVRHDWVTFEMALEYLRVYQPRVLYISLGETDDWAHDRRYDRVLETAHYFDSALEQLWAEIESNRYYRGATTLLVTTDHGRGVTTESWHSHGAEVAGAEQIWVAAIGPDTPPTGEAGPTKNYSQSDVAPTLVKALGLNPKEVLPEAVGEPIDLVFPPAAGAAQ